MCASVLILRAAEEVEGVCGICAAGETADRFSVERSRLVSFNRNVSQHVRG